MKIVDVGRLGVFLVGCATFAGVGLRGAQAGSPAPVGCTIAGERTVYEDVNGNEMPDEEDIRYGMVYAPATQTLVISGGQEVPPLPISQNGDRTEIQVPGGNDGASVRLLRRCGSSTYNSAEAIGWYGENTGEDGPPLVKGDLVDTDGDRKVDTIVGLFDVMGFGKAMFDQPLMFKQFDNQWFWYQPRNVMVMGMQSPISIGPGWFVPVDPETRTMEARCGDALDPVVIGEAATIGETGNCLGKPIPTLSQWGFAALVSLLFGAGAWTMRRGDLRDKVSMR